MDGKPESPKPPITEQGYDVDLQNLDEDRRRQDADRQRLFPQTGIGRRPVARDGYARPVQAPIQAVSVQLLPRTNRGTFSLCHESLDKFIPLVSFVLSFLFGWILSWSIQTENQTLFWRTYIFAVVASHVFSFSLIYRRFFWRLLRNLFSGR